jgi:hypothetical protein
MMKRYAQFACGPDCGLSDLIERPNGDWVLYEDAQAEIAAFSRAHFATLAVAIPTIEAGDIEGALKMLRAAAARLALSS